jgi:hypothetical protein
MIRDLTSLGTGHLKGMLAQVVRSFLRVRERMESDGGRILRPEAIGRTVLQALATARVVEAYEAYLSGTSLTTIRTRLASVAIELEHASEVSSTELLVGEKAALERELASYQTIEDLHARAVLAIVNLGTVLRRLEESLGTNGHGADVAAELARLAEELDTSRSAGPEMPSPPVGLEAT